jgi:hypothetical protein
VAPGFFVVGCWQVPGVWWRQHLGLLQHRWHVLLLGGLYIFTGTGVPRALHTTRKPAHRVQRCVSVRHMASRC